MGSSISFITQTTKRNVLALETEAKHIVDVVKIEIRYGKESCSYQFHPSITRESNVVSFLPLCLVPESIFTFSPEGKHVTVKITCKRKIVFEVDCLSSIDSVALKPLLDKKITLEDKDRTLRIYVESDRRFILALVYTFGPSQAISIGEGQNTPLAPLPTVFAGIDSWRP